MCTAKQGMKWCHLLLRVLHTWTKQQTAATSTTE